MEVAISIIADDVSSEETERLSALIATEDIELSISSIKPAVFSIVSCCRLAPFKTLSEAAAIFTVPSETLSVTDLILMSMSLRFDAILLIAMPREAISSSPLVSISIVRLPDAICPAAFSIFIIGFVINLETEK